MEFHSCTNITTVIPRPHTQYTLYH